MLKPELGGKEGLRLRHVNGVGGVELLDDDVAEPETQIRRHQVH